MNVTLEPITADNWRSVYRLTRTLTDEQQKFVAANAYSMLEALYEPNSFEALAIYHGEIVVGFLMTAYEADTRRYWVVRLMIGGDYQGKGYGHDALRLAIEKFRAEPDCAAIYISFEPGNEVARRLYEKLGFIDTRTIEQGELVYRLPLTENKLS